MRVILVVALCIPVAPGVSNATDSPFVRPVELTADIAFWQRIYTEVSNDGGLLHDSERLDVVYQVLNFDSGINAAVRSKQIESARKKVIDTLLQLGRGKDAALSLEQTRVRDAWPQNTTRAVFAAAAQRVRFQVGQADRFREGLVRSGRWREAIIDTFKRMDLPTELAALPHVESSFNTYAYSKVGAAGMWQFMRGTGKRFLRVDHVIDERLDPYKSTVAAASFLQQNYAILNSWPLAVTAYNHGAAGMRRAKERVGTDDIATIVRRYNSRTFGFASRNFYVAFLAALEIDTQPEKFFPGLVRSAPDASQVVQFEEYVSIPELVKVQKLDMASLQQLNPSLMPAVWNGSKRLPKGQAFRLPMHVEAAAVLAGVPKTLRYTAQIPDQAHRVTRGESLSEIAVRYGVSAQRLAALNQLRKPYRIYAGQVLRLPGAEGLAAIVNEKSAAVASLAANPAPEIQIQPKIQQDNIVAIPVESNETTTEQDDEPLSENEVAATETLLATGVHTADSADPTDYTVDANQTIRVEAAETLGHYADWLGLTTSQLRKINKFSSGTQLVIGRRLKLDFARATPEQFTVKRMNYHRQIQAAFFAQYRIVGSDVHQLKLGESVWILAQRKYNVPIWLLRQYNPDLDLATVRAGVKLIIPRVVEITTNGEAT